MEEGNLGIYGKKAGMVRGGFKYLSSWVAGELYPRSVSEMSRLCLPTCLNLLGYTAS
jgi:hypothetical protein